MDKYKKRSLNFSKDVQNRELRSMRITDNRANARFQRLSMIRNIDNDNESRKQPPNTSNPQTNVPAPVSSSRREMLKKWQEEKQLKKELERRTQKPVFKVSHIKYTYPRADMGENRNLLKNPPKFNPLQNKVSSAVSKAGAIPKAKASHSNSKAASQVHKITVAKQAIAKSTAIPRAVGSVKASQNVQQRTMGSQDLKFKQLSRPQPKTDYPKLPNQNTGSAKLQTSQATKYTTRSTQPNVKSISHPMKPTSVSHPMKSACVRSQQESEITFHCDISHINHNAASQQTSFAPENFAFVAPEGLYKYSFMDDSIAAVYLKHKAKVNAVPRRSTPKKNTPVSTETHETEKSNLKEAKLNLDAVNKVDLDNKMLNNSKDCSSEVETGAIQKTPSATIQEPTIGDGTSLATTIRQQSFKSDQENATLIEAKHSPEPSLVPLDNLEQIGQEIELIEQQLDHKATSESENQLPFPKQVKDPNNEKMKSPKNENDDTVFMLRKLDTIEENQELLEVAATAKNSRRNLASFTPRRSARLAALSERNSSSVSDLLQDVDDSVLLPRESHTGLTLAFDLMQFDTPPEKQAQRRATRRSTFSCGTPLRERNKATNSDDGKEPEAKMGQRKISLLYTPPKLRRSTRTSIKEDLISFSPSK